MRLWKEIKNYPVVDGWHTSEDGFRVKIGNWAKIGNGATIGNWATIGDGATIGNGAKIGDGATIGDEAKIGNWAKIGDGATIGDEAKIGDWAKIGDGATIGDEAKIGNRATIGDGAKIGNWAKIGDCFPQIWIMGKWWLHPFAPGKVRLGCYIGDYDTLLNRKQDDWDKHGYTAAHVEVILASLNYLKSIEHLVWDTSEVAA